MQLTLYENFSKRSNSTKRPEGGYNVDVKLKANTSVEAPVFLIDGVNLDVNYCKWLDNYYFIKNITLGNNNIYELECGIDVLASYKEYILDTSAYIEYASGGDTSIPDTRIPVRTRATVTTSSSESIFTYKGCYYVAITSTDSSGGHTGVYRVDDLANLNNLIPIVSDAFDPSGLDVVESIMQVGKNLVGAGSVAENIRSCFWMPFEASTDDFSHRLYVGLFLSECRGKQIKNMIQNFAYSIPIPWQYGDWRNTSPYTEVLVYLPYVGDVSYPASSLIGSDRLYIEYSINVLSGSIAYQVRAGKNGNILGVYSADIGVPYPIGSNGLNPTATANGLIAGVSGVMQASNTAGKILAAASATLSAVQPLNTSSGGIGGGAAAGLDLSIHIYVITHGTTVEPSTFASIWGYPLGIVNRIGNYSGYIQTSDCSVDAPLHDDKRTQLNMMLNAGIYLE